MYLTNIKTLCKIQTCEGFGEYAQGDDDHSDHTIYLIRYSHEFDIYGSVHRSTNQ